MSCSKLTSYSQCVRPPRPLPSLLRSVDCGAGGSILTRHQPCDLHKHSHIHTFTFTHNRYNLSVAITGYYTFDSCGSGFDTWLSVYAQTASGGYGSVVATCDDCGPCGTRVSFEPVFFYPSLYDNMLIRMEVTTIRLHIFFLLPRSFLVDLCPFRFNFIHASCSTLTTRSLLDILCVCADCPFQHQSDGTCKLLGGCRWIFHQQWRFHSLSDLSSG